jgi:hypothetical protein
VNNQQSSLSNFICRRLKSIAALTALMASLLVAGAFGQNNPVPEVVGPPHPQAVVPGSDAFTLTVYGANFVPGAVVNWNRQARTSTYISARELQAEILASDVAVAKAGYITVTNPAPAGGESSSSWSLVEVHTPTATIVPGAPNGYFYGGIELVNSIVVADFNNDGKPDLAAGLESGDIAVALGNGNASFNFASNATAVFDGSIFGAPTVAYGDFNGDGNLDLAFAADFQPVSSIIGMAVNLGNGNGTFDAGWRYRDGPSGEVINVVAGDFNRDGMLDLMGGDAVITYVFLGNGDGTFQLSKSYEGEGGINAVTGDFNGDGILDLAFFGDVVVGRQQEFPISVAFGIGDGTFRPPVTITTPDSGCSFGHVLLASDFNGDGNLDLAFCTESSIGILLGNGDGTFRPPAYYYVSSAWETGTGSFTFAAGDFNSDGNTDLIVSDNGLSDQFGILLGNGDGTFQRLAPVRIPGPLASGEAGIVTGDFNSDGLLDFIFQLGGYGFNVYPQQQK